MQSQETHNPPLIVIVGPTASGKSDLAVKAALLAKKHRIKAEVISADSRQIYKGLDLGSGKITKSEMRGIPHHMLDVANPKRQYSVAQYQKSARKILNLQLTTNDILPIICGGTALYIDALLYDYPIPEVEPNPALRKELEKKPTEELFAELLKNDPRRAETIDRNNRRRLIRALEIVLSTGAPVPLSPEKHLHAYSPIHANWSIPTILKIGLRPSDEILKMRIAKRLKARLKKGMIKEVERLHASGVSWRRLDDFGLEYRFISRYLRGIITKEEMQESIFKESWQYVKRQITWWKRDKEIHWVKNEREALTLLKQHIAKK